MKKRLLIGMGLLLVTAGCAMNKPADMMLTHDQKIETVAAFIELMKHMEKAPEITEIKISGRYGVVLNTNSSIQEVLRKIMVENGYSMRGENKGVGQLLPLPISYLFNEREDGYLMSMLEVETPEMVVRATAMYASDGRRSVAMIKIPQSVGWQTEEKKPETYDQEEIGDR